jgi:diguanylate cyclase (GGDEF)-like protein
MVIVSFLLSTGVSLLSLSLVVHNNVKDIDTILAARIYESVSSQLSEPLTVAKAMANSSFLINTLKQEKPGRDPETEQRLKAYLYGIQSGMSYTTAFVISDITKRYYTCEGVTKIIRPGTDEMDSWYIQFLEGDQDFDLDVDMDEDSHSEWIVYVNGKVRDVDGRLLGVCGVGIHMTNLQDLFYTLEKEYNVKILLVDTDGLVQVDTDAINIEKAYHENLPVSMKNRSEYVYQKGKGSEFTVTKYVENLGWYLVVKSSGAGTPTQYLNVVMINLLLCLLVLAILIFSMRHIRKRNRELSDASFKDQITQLYNRRAYEEDKAAWSSEPLEDGFTHIAADLNGLKKANDTFGHDAGDELIKGAAVCLKRCFAPYGRVYRTGGDEFAAILTISDKHLAAVLEELEEVTSSWSGTLNKNLSISTGAATHSEFPDESLEGLVRISDDRMYAAKAAYYRRSGQQPR